jgi:hypothetical protein
MHYLNGRKHIALTTYSALEQTAIQYNIVIGPTNKLLFIGYSIYS